MDLDRPLFQFIPGIGSVPVEESWDSPAVCLLIDLGLISRRTVVPTGPTFEISVCTNGPRENDARLSEALPHSLWIKNVYVLFEIFSAYLGD